MRWLLAQRLQVAVGPVFSERLSATLLAKGASVRRPARRRLRRHGDGGGQRGLRLLRARDRALLRAGPLCRLLVVDGARRAQEAPGRRTRAERGARGRRVARAVPPSGAACAAGAALRGRGLPRVRQLLLHLLERAGKNRRQSAHRTLPI